MNVPPNLGPRSRKLPHFSEYIAQSAHSRVFDTKSEPAHTLAILLGVSVGFIAHQWNSTMVSVAIGFAVFIGCATAAEFFLARRDTKSPADRKRKTDLHTLYRRLNGYLSGGRLHRYLEPVAAALLEEGAKRWRRAHAALSSSTWSSPDLPDRYCRVRDDARAAADTAMEDLTLLLQSSIRSQPKTDEWQLAFTKILGDVIGVNMDEPADEATFPIEYTPARTIVDKLGRLATDIEAQSTRLHADGFATEMYRGASGIDATLANLRELNQAEDELIERLRH